MDQPAPRRSSRFTAFLTVLVIVASGLGALIYQALQNRERGRMDATGFDIATAVETAPGHASPSPVPLPGQPPQVSGLGMVKTGMPGMEFGAKAGARAPKDPAAALTGLVRGNEARTRALFLDYKRRYPILRQYERDWASHPDLRKLHEDYRRDHDPVAFMRGLARSPNFGTMLRKYATEPAIRDFAKDALKTAPSGIISAGMDFLKEDKNMKSLTDQVASALGLPAGMFAEGAESKVDQKAVMDSVMKSHPELQKASENPGAVKLR